MSCPYLTSKSEVILTNIVPGGPKTTKEISLPVCKLCRKLDSNSWAARCRNTPPEGPCYIWVEQFGRILDPQFDSIQPEAESIGEISIEVLPVEVPEINLNFLHAEC